MLMTGDMKPDTSALAKELYRQGKLERAQFAAIHLMETQILKENRSANSYFRRDMIDSDVACRMSFYSWSAAEKAEILRDVGREWRLQWTD